MPTRWSSILTSILDTILQLFFREMLKNLCEYKPVVASFRDVCLQSVSYDSKPTPKERTCLDKEKNVIMAFSECCTENESKNEGLVLMSKLKNSTNGWGAAARNDKEGQLIIGIKDS